MDGPEKGQWENGCRGSRIPKVDADVTPVEGLAPAAAIRESYGLALAACIYVGGRQGDGHARHLLWEMRAQGVAPNLVIYRELARAGLAVGEGGREGGEAGKRERIGGATRIFRKLLAMVPAEASLAGQVQDQAFPSPSSSPISSPPSIPPSFPSSPFAAAPAQARKGLTVQCRDREEARWLALLVETKAQGDVGGALSILAEGLAAWGGERKGGKEGGMEGVALACNVVLSTCIKGGRWEAAEQVGGEGGREGKIEEAKIDDK